MDMYCGFTVTVIQQMESPHSYIFYWREIVLTWRIFFSETRLYFKKKNKEINMISAFYGCKRQKCLTTKGITS